MLTRKPVQKSDWKQYSAGTVSHSGAHYLMAVHQLHKELGYARGTDIAKQLDVSPPSAALALNRLQARGLVQEDRNRFCSLTEAGLQQVENILAHRRVLKHFFVDALGVDEITAEADACRTEHLISDTTSRKLVQFLNLLSIDPDLQHARDRLHTMGQHTPCRFPDACEICESECVLKSPSP